jgi:hypothetical protein
MKQLMTFVLMIAMFVCSATARADYSCRDISELERTLETLRQNCDGDGQNGGSQGGATFCRALGYLGGNAMEAVANCSGPGTRYTREQCVQALNCQGNFSYCEAKGYIGNDPFSAVKQCSAGGTPYTTEQCTEALNCRGHHQHYCTAKGYFALTPEETVAKCSAAGTPFSREECTTYLHCQ